MTGKPRKQTAFMTVTENTQVYEVFQREFECIGPPFKSGRVGLMNRQLPHLGGVL